MQLRDSSVVLYYQPAGQGNTLGRRHRMLHARKTQYSGTMTEGAKKRMIKAVTLMSQAIKPKWIFNEVTGRMQLHRFSFITLTVSSKKNLTAKEAYPLLLKPFLRWLKETKGVNLYIWKAELQQRGQIHYHVIIPDFIHYRDIRSKWNKLQREAGLLDNYAAKHNHFNAPSTEIKETRMVKNMTSYITKELTKTINAKRLKARKMVTSLIQAGEIPADKYDQFVDEYTGEEMKTDGKVWGCSENIAGVPYFSVLLRHDAAHLLAAWTAAGETREVSGDWWSVIYFNSKAPPDLLNENETTLYNDHFKPLLN